MSYTAIMEGLRQFKEMAENEGLDVHAVALKGSQNYNLDDEKSDIDCNIVFIPTLKQIRSKQSYKFNIEGLGECTAHNLFEFATIAAKGNPQWIECIHTKYKIGDLSVFEHYDINPSALYGMALEKYHSLDRPYPSKQKEIEEFGYDPKQLHHIVRLYDLAISGKKVFRYTANSAITEMMALKRNGNGKTLEQAREMAQMYIGLLKDIRDEYVEENGKFETQPIDWDVLDEIWHENRNKRKPKSTPMSV